MDLGSIPGVTMQSFALPELDYLEFLFLSSNHLKGVSAFF
jgi:hypothetical protein